MGLFVLWHRIKINKMTETYDEMEWDIDEMPIGSSTPDEMFELIYSATTRCPMCNHRIEGEAHYWAREDDMSDAWLTRIDYEDCDCDSNEDELEDYLKD